MYKYLLVDHFSKYAQAFPTKNKSGRAAAEILFSKFFLDFGFSPKFYTLKGENLTKSDILVQYHISLPPENVKKP